MQFRARPALLLPALLLALAIASPAAAGPYIVVEAESGKVIAQHDAGRQWYPASVTKLMTVYLTFRALRAGTVKLDTLIPVSVTAQAQPPSKMGVPVGAQITVDNALKMLMVKSANDIAVVLAEGVGGSLSAFVKQMNMAADDLGMNGTQFMNPNGLPDENQVTTARDMAILARALIREFPEYAVLFRIPAIQFGRRLMRNHNRLIDRYPGADGMKTGFICSSGFNVVATAKRGDKHLIVVVFGAPNSAQRAQEAARLFEIGFGGPFGVANLFAGDRPTLEQLANVAVGPVDMRSETCERRRGKKRVAESDIDDDDVPELALLRANTKQSLLIDLPPSMPPVRVWVGAKPSTATAEVEPRRKKTRKSRVSEKKKAADPTVAADETPKPKKTTRTKTRTKSTETKAKMKASPASVKQKAAPKPSAAVPETPPARTRLSAPLSILPRGG